MPGHLTISSIFLDIGGVLLEVDEKGALIEFARGTGVPPEQLRHRMGGEILHALERGKITLRGYHAAVFKDTGGCTPLPYDRFERIWLGLLKGESPVTGLLPTLKKQAEVWFLSNSNQTHMGYLREHYPFMAQADGVISSHEVGYRKPDREIFQLALHRSGTTARQALFVDDKAENVAAAGELGIHAHHYTGLRELLAFLGVYGLKVPQDVRRRILSAG